MKIRVEPPPHFSRLYYALMHAKRALSLESIVSFNTVDANDNTYPIAYVAVELETKKTWSWFLEFLIDDLGPVSDHGWIFISNQQKGLNKAFDIVVPQAQHIWCVRHMYGNFKDKFKGEGLKDLLWSATRATNRYEFEVEMNELKDMNGAAYDWLMSKDLDKRHPEDYVAICYYKDTYLKAYEPIIHHVKGFQMWPRLNQTPLSPPLIRKQPGRPRRSRKKDHEMEKIVDAIGANLRRKMIVTCTRSFQKGHNKRNCKNQPQDPLPGTYIDKRWTTGYPSKKKRASKTNASTSEMSAREKLITCDFAAWLASSVNLSASASVNPSASVHPTPRQGPRMLGVSSSCHTPGSTPP
ncbi:hypothetical protein L3X38_043248 [Prunus dulcis]|uniref:MULE transposase domain-containing protein n=1 Tax=Prunus dulcis TaxID=3755 RepID=A0AAD4UYG1_PRUDU|nr:hypothetical protein L3X38_043248 [Prunus dulcis]